MTREEALDVLIIKANKGEFVKDILNQIFDEHEADIKDKDKQLNSLEVLLGEAYVSHVEKQAQKARSIVAMLFWEYKKSYRMLKKYTNTKKEHDIKIIMYERDNKFKQAYSMLKNNND